MTRLLDVLLATLALFLLSPLLVVVALLVKVSSAGPVIYRGERVGRGGSSFEILKFRTMRHGDSNGFHITRAGDTRITPVGRLLRRFKLDELPQLWNVVRGDMALVGPRPEHPHYVEMYTAEQRRILDFRPGITSPSSIEFSDEESRLQGPDWERHYVEIVMPAKLKRDLEYFERRTVISDLRVVLRTASVLFRRR